MKVGPVYVAWSGIPSVNLVKINWGGDAWPGHTHAFVCLPIGISPDSLNLNTLDHDVPGSYLSVKVMSSSQSIQVTNIKCRSGWNKLRWGRVAEGTIVVYWPIGPIHLPGYNRFLCKGHRLDAHWTTACNRMQSYLQICNKYNKIGCNTACNRMQSYLAAWHFWPQSLHLV